MQDMLLIYGNEDAWNDLAANGRDALDAAHREETTFSQVEIRALMH